MHMTREKQKETLGELQKSDYLSWHLLVQSEHIARWIFSAIKPSKQNFCLYQCLCFCTLQWYSISSPLWYNPIWNTPCFKPCFFNTGLFYTFFTCGPTGIIIFLTSHCGVPTRVPVCGATSVRLSSMNIIRSFPPDIRVPRENKWIVLNSIRAGEQTTISHRAQIMSAAGAYTQRWTRSSRRENMHADAPSIWRDLMLQPMISRRYGPVSSARRWSLTAVLPMLSCGLPKMRSKKWIRWFFTRCEAVKLSAMIQNNSIEERFIKIISESQKKWKN